MSRHAMTAREAVEHAAAPLTVDDAITTACTELAAALTDPDTERLTAIGAALDDWGPAMPDLRELGRLAQTLVEAAR